MRLKSFGEFYSTEKEFKDNNMNRIDIKTILFKFLSPHE